MNSNHVKLTQHICNELKQNYKTLPSSVNLFVFLKKLYYFDNSF